MNDREHTILEENKYEESIKAFADRLGDAIEDLQNRKQNLQENAKSTIDHTRMKVGDAVEDLQARKEKLQDTTKEAVSTTKAKIDDAISQVKEHKENLRDRAIDFKQMSAEEWEKYSEKIDTSLSKMEYEIDTATTGIRRGLEYLANKFKN